MIWHLEATEKVAGSWLSKALRDAHAAMEAAQTTTEIDVQVIHAIRVAEALAHEVCDRDADGNPAGLVTVQVSGHAGGSAPRFINVTVTQAASGLKGEAPKRKKA